MSYQALLFCSDEKTARVVTQVLTELDFSVDACNEPFAAVKKLMAQHFDAVVVDCDNEQNATLLFKSARNSGSNQNALSVAVVEGQAGVAKAFRIGANLVLTKPINIEQSKGTLRVARGLLRKAEAGKPTAVEPATRPPQTSANVTASIAPVPFPVPSSTAQPAMSASAPTFEIDEEPEPKPEPAEAALLDSMPDPTARAPRPAAPAMETQAPWPTGSRISEPMANALRSASEATAKSAVETPAATPSATDTGKFKNLSFGSKPGTGAAAAPAPAKESAVTSSPVAPAPRKPRVSPFTQPEAEESHDPGTKQDEVAGKSASKSKLPVIAIAAVVLVAAGYFGWTKMHNQASAPAASVTSPATVVPSQVAPQAPTPQTQPASAALTADTVQHAASSTAKPSAGKPIQDEEPDVITITPATHNPPPVVKATPVQAEASAEPIPSMPGAIGIPTSSDNKQIAGIVASTPTSMPRSTPQTLRISQGVSQGLVIKKVQPQYPQAAQQMRIQGAVQLEATISKTGDITNLKVVSGDPILARAATDAVRKWKYNPYFLNGEPVEIQTGITVNFKLP